MEKQWDPSLYNESANIQKKHASEIFGEILNLLSKNRVFENLLDVGCGPGDTLVDFILPKLEKLPHKILALDTSQEMISCARQKYSNQMDFILCDIQTEKLAESLASRSFDLITSFYCWQWIRNESQALSNIYMLLEEEGIFTMVLPVGRHLFGSAVITLSKVDKYKPYLVNIEENLPWTYFHEQHPEETMRSKLIKAGFEVLTVEAREMKFVFPSSGDLKNLYKSVSNFKMHDDIMEDFFDDAVSFMIDNCKCVGSTIEFTYKLLICCATK